MKYLLQNFKRDDKDAPFQPLREWARDSNVTVCNFFFKGLGRFDQRSLNGLSQSLMYQILRKHRNLIEHAVPDMWTSLLDHPGRDLEMPSTKQMCEAAQNVAASPRTADTYFCFIIDGLDEFDERHWEAEHERGQEPHQEDRQKARKEADLLKELLASLVALPHVKLLISSRPTSEYVDMFKSCSKLAMQDLTRGCIKSYIDGELRTNPYFEELMKTQPDETCSLLDAVADRASGIFLWVNLACRSLLDGASGYDTLEELSERVKELPTELEKMFVHMLNYHKIGPKHKKQGAQVLAFCREFHKTKALDGKALGLPSEIREHYESASGPSREVTEPEIMAQTLARIEESMFSSVNPVVLEDPKDIDVLVSKLEARLRMRCGGLLEIQREDPNDANSPRQVVFIHRSVQEFLNAKQGTEFLSQHIEEGWDLQWTRTLYWIQRIADIYGGDTPMRQGLCTFRRNSLAAHFQLPNLDHARRPPLPTNPRAARGTPEQRTKHGQETLEPPL